MHLSPPVALAAVRSKAVVLLLLTFCLLLLPLCESVIVLCFVVRCFVSVLVLQSSWWGRESWLLCLICLPGVSWWLSGSSSRCHRVVCSLWLWHFLIILTYYFCYTCNLKFLLTHFLKTANIISTKVFIRTVRSSMVYTQMYLMFCRSSLNRFSCMLNEFNFHCWQLHFENK